MKKIVVFLLACTLTAGAADNLIRGYQFDGATGLKTGAMLEDLVTQSMFTQAAAMTNNAERMFDGTSITTTNNGIGTTNWVAAVKDGGITRAKIADDAVDGSKIEAGSIDATHVIPGGGFIDYYIASGQVFTQRTAESGNMYTNLANGGTGWAMATLNGSFPSPCKGVWVENQAAAFDHTNCTVKLETRATGSSPTLTINQATSGDWTGSGIYAPNFSRNLTYIPVSSSNTFEFRLYATNFNAAATGVMRAEMFLMGVGYR